MHETVIAPPASPSYTPLASVSDAMRRTIWGHIFEAVINCTSGIDFQRVRSKLMRAVRDPDAEDPSHLISKLPHGPVGQCMSVCKEWKEIIAPLACRNLYLPTPAKAANFLEWIATRPDTSELAAGVRSIRFNRIYEPPLGDPKDLAALCDASFIGRFRNLEELRCDCFHLSSKALGTLPTVHLRSLSIKSDCGEFILPSFPSLRTLRWKVENPAVIQPSNADPAPSMPALETLIVSGDGAPNILLGLSNFSLPAIASIEFNDRVCNDEPALREFCAANGASIRKVINLGKSDMLSTLLPLCPGLTSLSISWVHLANLIDNIRQCPPHASLEEITYADLNVRPRYTKSKANEATMILFTRFCDELEPNKFPALHTIRLPDYNIWPKTQHDIAGHPLPAIAEKMLDRGVRIVDSSGTGWKPRLTRGKKKAGT